MMHFPAVEWMRRIVPENSPIPKTDNGISMGWSKTRRHINVLLRRSMRNLIFPTAPPRASTSIRSWVDAQHDGSHSYRIIDEDQRWRRRPPRTIEPELHWRFHELEACRPPTFVATIEHGRLFGKYGVVITPDNLVAVDVCPEYGQNPGDHTVLSQGNLPRCVEAPGRIGVIATKGCQGYFHWLFDAVPRLGLLEREQIDQYYVDTECSFQREYLQLMGVGDHQILPATRYTHVRPDVVVASSLPGKCGVATTRTRSFLRRLLDRADAKPAAGKRIYVSRGDVPRRRVTNEAAVIASLNHFGFEEVRLTQLSVAEQIRLFAQAEAVVGPHGAGLSNLVYVDPGTRVLELFAPTYVNVCYWTLSCLGDLTYWYLQGVGERPPAGVDPHRHHDNITVDLGSLEKSIRAMLD